MNAVEHIDYLAERRASAPQGSLRAILYGCEGVEATDDAIRRGLHAWAVERRFGSSGHRLLATAIVFGRSPSDALRRASAPARMGPGMHGDASRAALIASGWDERVAWPVVR